MSTRNIRRNLKELAENTMAAYLKSRVTGEMKCYAAYPPGKVQYPCVVCGVQRLAAVSELASWDDNRGMIMELAVISEAVPKRANDVAVQTARERNADMRSDVLNAVCIDDLNASLALVAVPGIAFSMAQVTDVRYEIEDRKFISIVEVELIVEPVDESQ